MYVVSVNYRPSTNSKVVSIFRIQFSRTQNRCMSFSMLGDELTEMYFLFYEGNTAVERQGMQTCYQCFRCVTLQCGLG